MSRFARSGTGGTPDGGETMTLLELVFYGREGTRALPVNSDSYVRLIEALKRLSAGDRDIPAYFILGVNPKVAALIAVKEVQSVYCVDIGRNASYSERESVEGMEFYLTGREEPVHINLDPGGPISDMLVAMTETGYGDLDEGCVMMPDHDGNPFLFVPADVQYILMERVYVEGVGPSPD